MADPVKYTQSFDFSGFQSNNPTTPLPGTRVDIELQDIETSNNQIVDALKDVRRSDGKLKNGIVTPESLGPGVLDGVQGPAGPEGPVGPVGPQGPRGLTGPVGPVGPEGPQGVQGVQGVQGLAGQSFTPDAIGPVSEQSSYDDEPEGFAFLDATNGLLYFKLSNASGDWSVGAMFGRGPQGPQGQQGIQGPQGVQGEQGIQGPSVSDGGKGDITVSGSGVVWSLNDGVVFDVNLAPTSAVYHRTRDQLSISDFGATESAPNNFTAVQDAITETAGLGTTLIVPAGEFVVDGALVSMGNLSLVGAGASSRLILEDGSSLVCDGGSVSYPNQQIYLKDLSLRVRGWINAPVLTAQFSEKDDVSGSFRTVVLDNIDIQGEGANDGFLVGLDLINCTNHVRKNVMVKNGQYITGQGANGIGRKGIRDNTIGIRVSGNEQPIDMYAWGDAVYFCEMALNELGAGADQGFEGLVHIGGKYLFNNRGWVLNSLTVHDYAAAHLCNFNCFTRDIVVTDMHNVHLTGNLLYIVDSQAEDNPVADWTAIEIQNNDAAFTIPSNNIISGNSIFGNTAGGAVQKTGISVQGVNGARTDTVIGNNAMSSLAYGVNLFGGSNNVSVLDTNIFSGVTTRVVNSGASTNNVSELVSTASASYRRDNSGRLVKSGNGSYTITGNKVTIPINTTALGGAFKTRIVDAHATNQFPAALPNEVISFDRASSTLSSLVFHCGTTASGNIELSWTAEGI